MNEENTALNITFDHTFEIVTNSAAGLIEVAVAAIAETGGAPTPGALAQTLGMMFKSTIEDINENDLNPDHIMALTAIGASIFAIASLSNEHEDPAEESRIVTP